MGDLVGLLDALQISDTIIVGHDWGANVAWNEELMRPDRFMAVFCLAAPYSQRGDLSVLDAMRAAGHGSNFYMFGQIDPEADQIWSDAAVTIPGVQSHPETSKGFLSPPSDASSGICGAGKHAKKRLCRGVRLGWGG